MTVRELIGKLNSEQVNPNAKVAFRVWSLGAKGKMLSANPAEFDVITNHDGVAVVSLVSPKMAKGKEAANASRNH
jgi:hypothetical protein